MNPQKATSEVRASAGLLAVFLLALVHLQPAAAQDTDHGHALLRENCARCHAIEATGTSPLPGAPAFRTLHERYPLENLEEALAEGIITGHPEMPELAFEPDDIGDIIAYMKSLGD